MKECTHLHTPQLSTLMSKDAPNTLRANGIGAALVAVGLSSAYS